MTKPAVFRTIREQIADRLRHEVLSGQLAAGVPLRETQLAERFGVSRGPIRDALLQLTQEGLLTYQPNVGVKVGNGPDESLRNLILVLRRKIERNAVETGFERFTPEHVRHWESLLEQLRIACEQGDMPTLVEADMAIHRSILEAAGGDDLVAIWLPIVLRMRLWYSRHTDLMEVYREHVPIIEAARRGDREAMAQALEDNIW